MCFSIIGGFCRNSVGGSLAEAGVLAVERVGRLVVGGRCKSNYGFLQKTFDANVSKEMHPLAFESSWFAVPGRKESAALI